MVRNKLDKYKKSLGIDSITKSDVFDFDEHELNLCSILSQVVAYILRVIPHSSDPI